MKILNKAFAEQWSWTFTVKGLQKALSQHEWEDQTGTVKCDGSGCDVILSQQITLMNNITEKDKTVCRLGGNRSFDEDRPTNYESELRATYAIIATNKKLYEIGKKHNPNTYLIPNGLDLKEWAPTQKKGRGFVVGFAGNIRSASYRLYKGYDLAEEACKTAKVELRTALFGNFQIPHPKMRELFYSQINVLVHPTRGEGCSNVIMEALACGIPVITTQTAGYHGETLKDGENALFCERTAESIMACIRKLKGNKKLRDKIGRNARKYAEKHHDILKIAKQYDEIFLACAKAGKERAKTQEYDTNKTVTVQACTLLYEEGNRKPGDFFQITLSRAKQLGDLVRITE